MNPSPTTGLVEPFVIRRHGAFFRPDAAGYTTHIGSAGFYTEAEARKYLDAEGVSVHPLSEFRDQAGAVLAGADRLRAALSLSQPTVDREAIARAAYKADFLHRMKDVPATFDFDWAWNECASMPLSGPGFVGQWYAIADAILAVLNPQTLKVGSEGGGV